jgi:shikimate kinase
MELMNHKGFTVYLNPGIEKIAERIWKSHKITRPLFSQCKDKSEVQEKLNKLYNNRDQFYSKSKATLTEWDEFSIRNLETR